MVSTKIPWKILYEIDRIVREKLRKKRLNFKNFDVLSQEDYLYQDALSPQAKDKNLLKETRDMLNFMTPVKNSEGIDTKVMKSPYR